MPTVLVTPSSLFVLLLFAFCLLLSIGCRTDMQDQPKMKPYRSSTFFNDGLSSRPLVEGTVPRGFLKADTEYFTGKKAGRATAGTSTLPNGPQPSAQPSVQPSASSTAAPGVPTGAAAYPDDVEVFPIPVTKEMVNRGKERYQIFCSACHGPTGDGDGMIVRRGFRRAASFNDDRLRQAPVGHFFDAVTNGWGAMPSYAPQIPVQDRWAIIAYIRALQLKNEMQSPTQTSVPTASATPEGGRHQ
jgi:mono/diheme cytochrome c family protein